MSMGRKPYTPEQIGERRKNLIAQGKGLAIQLGRVPYATDFKKENGTYSYTTIEKVFGSWNNFVEACELKVNKVTYVPKDELIWSLLSLKRSLGKTPTKYEFNEYSKANNLGSSEVAVRQFGSWNKFLTHCGLEVNYDRK